MNSTVVNATQCRKLLRLEYDGYFRVVEPHAYGVTTEDNAVLRCFQISGGSKSNEQGWKLLRLNETHLISEGGDPFRQPRPGYRRGDKAMAQVFVEL